MPRRRYPSITKGDDGYWHAYITVGTKPNGRPDQRHVKRRTKAEVEARLDELMDQVRVGSVQRPGRGPTVQSWLLDTYLGVIAPAKIDPTTIAGYRSKIVNYVVPVIGRMRMDRVTADNIEAVYTAMRRTGRADSTILQVHRILARAWRVAARRRVVPRNVMEDLDAPTAKQIELQPLTEDEARAILRAAQGRRNAARWSVGLALGLRQGEALGLRWSYVDLDKGEMRVWWQLHRRPHEHGCGTGTPPTCGRRRGGNCPQKVLPVRSGETVVAGGLILKEPKGKGRRTVPIPPELVKALRAHREVQDLERQFAGGAYLRHGFVFADPLGGPTDPAEDWREWKSLLTAAGVRDSRVHDTRHTAATLLLAQGVDIRVVQEILGHSSIKVTEGYAHVASPLVREAVQRMGRTLFR